MNAAVPPTYEPVGGNTYAFASVEYSFEIVDPLRVAFFYDVGFVNADAYDFDYTDYNDNFGVGLRLMVGGAPLSLDFGVPITGTTNADQLSIAATGIFNHNTRAFTLNNGTGTDLTLDGRLNIASGAVYTSNAGTATVSYTLTTGCRITEVVTVYALPYIPLYAPYPNRLHVPKF